jgi:translation initiation factor IF-1
VIVAMSARACRVELANGHQMVAHNTSRNRIDLNRMTPGDKLTITASPFDFSKGRVVGG